MEYTNINGQKVRTYERDGIKLYHAGEAMIAIGFRPNKGGSNSRVLNRHVSASNRVRIKAHPGEEPNIKNPVRSCVTAEGVEELKGGYELVKKWIVAYRPVKEEEQEPLVSGRTTIRLVDDTTCEVIYNEVPQFYLLYARKQDFWIRVPLDGNWKFATPFCNGVNDKLAEKLDELFKTDYIRNTEWIYLK